MFSINHSSTIFLPMITLRQQEPIKNLISLNCEKLPWNIRTCSAWQRLGNVAERLEPSTGLVIWKTRVQVPPWPLTGFVLGSRVFRSFLLFNNLDSLRSKRFRLVTEQRKTGFGRERNETRAKNSFTCTIFREVGFDSRSSFFAPKPHGNACYAGYNLDSKFFFCLIYCIEVLTHSMYDNVYLSAG